MTIARPIEERFWEKVDRRGPDECWIWHGTILNVGYGQFQIGRSGKVGAHRLAYELEVGPIPEGLTIDHLCCVPLCVNPAHLEPVTQSENSKRRGQRQTHCKRGHEFTEENTWRDPKRNSRTCRACGRARANQRYWARKAAS